MPNYTASPTTEQIVRQLQASPRLPQVTQALQAILQDEAAARQRFYDTLTEDQKAEFINGAIIVQSPAKFRHISASDNLLILLKTYVLRHSLGFVGHEKLLVTLTRNDYEPDICFWRAEVAQTFAPDQMKFPAPDFIVEVLSPSTEAIDRGIKAEDYALHGVAEYWLVDPEQAFVEQYALRGEVYELVNKVHTNTISSSVVAGFEIPARAIFDAAEQLTALQAILG